MSLEFGGEVTASQDLNLGELPELVPVVTYFLQGLAKSLREETVKVPSPKPQ